MMDVNAGFAAAIRQYIHPNARRLLQGNEAAQMSADDFRLLVFGVLCAAKRAAAAALLASVGCGGTRRRGVVWF